MSRSISLPMYDFDEVQPSTDALLMAIVGAVRELGEDVVAGNASDLEHSSLTAYWASDEMYMSQSCGLPYLEELHEVVDVLGTFLWDGISDGAGNYRTHIVVRGEHEATEIMELRGARPVVSNPQSLSGWCSLGCALAGVTNDPNFVQPYLIGHNHVGSIQLLQDGIADVASIDPATFQLLRRHRPSLVHGLRTIGSGPLTPATPIIVNKERRTSLDNLRDALHQVFAQDSLTSAIDDLGIVGFVNLDGDDYAPVHELVALAETVLPRRE
ncbi:MAG: PhnD/SsuA/transferrin family substrate-binding protein [Ilumatobacteraceae bacterium]